MNTLNLIEQIQMECGNKVPKVATYMQIEMRSHRGVDVREELRKLILENKIIWGTTRHTWWFATKLDDFDKQQIDSLSDWTIDVSGL